MRGERWPAEKAREWFDARGWLVGCNFIPSTAVNQLEMWQDDTLDEATIRRELGWAADLGFNTLRVYLHDLAWDVDRDGFFKRVDRFLAMAFSFGIVILPVVFDDCWHRDPRPGKQPDPLPGIHNSRWLQSPGMAVLRDRGAWARLEAYVKDLISTFEHDERILAWDLYNENGNYFLPALSKAQPRKALALAGIIFRKSIFPNRSLELLKETFRWARACAPDQPLTAGIWFPDPRLNRYLLGESDIITFHNYEGVESLERQIARLKRTGRPLLCTEFMARTRGSRFETHLPVFRREGVGCYSWGLVAGKTNTIFSWQDRGGAAEPEVWFHDILRPEGSPFDRNEVDCIRRITGRSAGEQGS
ncbi:MAG: 1,4-beta-xylanase [Spirochaetes bacterium]|nr:1,4-beta-xylanase [Spirochaetota bacterium]